MRTTRVHFIMPHTEKKKYIFYIFFQRDSTILWYLPFSSFFFQKNKVTGTTKKKLPQFALLPELRCEDQDYKIQMTKNKNKISNSLLLCTACCLVCAHRNVLNFFLKVVDNPAEEKNIYMCTFRKIHLIV